MIDRAKVQSSVCSTLALVPTLHRRLEIDGLRWHRNPKTIYRVRLIIRHIHVGPVEWDIPDLMESCYVKFPGHDGDAGNLLCRYLHEFLLGALGTDNVLSVGDEALAHEGGLALRANEAIVVPVAVLKWDEAGAANAWNRKISMVRLW